MGIVSIKNGARFRLNNLLLWSAPKACFKCKRLYRVERFVGGTIAGSGRPVVSAAIGVEP